MKKFLNTQLIVLLPLILPAQSPEGKGYKPIILDDTYNHTKYKTEPADIIFKFSAYTTSFDSEDDNNNDGTSDTWGIPEWVSYEVKTKTKETEKYSRPKWMTDSKLYEQGIAPNDDSYRVSGTRELKEVTSSYRYVRGHMCPKDAADRISMEAGFNTHTVLNAVPQLQWQNNGIWKKLESKVTDWADEYNSVWVICGGVFFNRTPSLWLGQKDEVKVAVPDALYKVVIKETDNAVESLTFIIPNVIPKEKKDFREYLTSLGRLEELTGLKFITNLSNSEQEKIKGKHLNLSITEKKKVVDSW